MLTLKINGQTVQAEPGTTVLKVAQQVGIDIPTLCYHPALPPDGGCRVCLVEVKGWPTLQAACTLQATEGMEVETDSPAVQAARRRVLELLLANYTPGVGRYAKERTQPAPGIGRTLWHTAPTLSRQPPGLSDRGLQPLHSRGPQRLRPVLALPARLRLSERRGGHRRLQPGRERAHRLRPG